MSILYAGLLGLAAGLLVNYLSDVLPRARKLERPACQSCGEKISWKDYLLLSACRSCHRPRTWRAYLTLVAGSGFSIWIWLSRPAWMEFWLGLLLLAYLGLVIVIDLEHRLILHQVTLVGAVLGLVTGLARFGSAHLARILLGGLTGLLIMLIIYGFGILFARARAKKLGVDDGEEALGFGDVTISAVLGLMVGFPNIVLGLTTGVLLAGIFSLLLLLTLWLQKKFETAAIYIAYGPFLVLGAGVYIFFR